MAKIMFSLFSFTQGKCIPGDEDYLECVRRLEGTESSASGARNLLETYEETGATYYEPKPVDEDEDYDEIFGADEIFGTAPYDVEGAGSVEEPKPVYDVEGAGSVEEPKPVDEAEDYYDLVEWEGEWVTELEWEALNRPDDDELFSLRGAGGNRQEDTGRSVSYQIINEVGHQINHGQPGSGKSSVTSFSATNPRSVNNNFEIKSFVHNTSDDKTTIAAIAIGFFFVCSLAAFFIVRRRKTNDDSRKAPNAGRKEVNSKSSKSLDTRVQYGVSHRQGTSRRHSQGGRATLASEVERSFSEMSGIKPSTSGRKLSKRRNKSLQGRSKSQQNKPKSDARKSLQKRSKSQQNKPKSSDAMRKLSRNGVKSAKQ